MNKILLSKTKNNSVVFCSPIRNCEQYIESVMNNIFNIGSLFKKWYLVLVESDSTDHTLVVLNNYVKKYSNITVISLGNLEKRIQSRTCRIALARNTALNYCNENLIDDIDYYISMCFDDVNSQPIDIEGILSCWKYDNWAGMCANQEKYYYDVWCLRSEWCNYDCWEMVNKRPNYMTHEAAVKKYVIANQLTIPKYYGLIEVDAAHGGLSIYDKNYIKNCRYEGLNYNKTFEECDLINFCRGVKRNGGKIFINSEMINMREQ